MALATKPARRLGAVGPYGYPRSHRIFELAALGIVSILGSVLLVRVVAEIAARHDVWLFASVGALALLALAVADLLSGIVHCLFDTFGSPDTPLIGQKFVKPFRDHHDDPSAMTRGDFVAVNADNFFVALPLVVGGTLLDVHSSPRVATFLLALTAGVCLTNQIHKWAHVEAPAGWVGWLQRHRLILSVEEHRRHHTRPFDSHYCITWGRMNPLLNLVVRRLRARR